MLPALLVLGVAFALAYGPLTIAATDGVEEQEQGLAGGMLTTSFQFGAALGLAVVTAVVVTASGGGPLSYDALRAGLLVALAAAVVGVVVTAPGLRTHARAVMRPDPERSTDECTNSSASAGAEAALSSRACHR